MNKIAAAVREAEVRGALAAFIDGGLMESLEQASFDKLASDVAGMLEDGYTVEDIATCAGQCLNPEASQEKTAAEAVQFAMGGLLMNKIAGVITDEQFAEAVESLLKEAAEAKMPKPKTPGKKTMPAQIADDQAKKELAKAKQEAAAGKKAIEESAKQISKYKKLLKGVGAAGALGTVAAGVAGYQSGKNS